MQNIGKPKYGVIDSGMWGLRIVSGIVTGIRFTEDKPIYELSFGKDKYQTSQLFDTPEEIIKLMNLAPLDRVKETHGLKIKFGQ